MHEGSPYTNVSEQLESLLVLRQLHEGFDHRERAAGHRPLLLERVERPPYRGQLPERSVCVAVHEPVVLFAGPESRREEGGVGGDDGRRAPGQFVGTAGHGRDGGEQQRHRDEPQSSRQAEAVTGRQREKNAAHGGNPSAGRGEETTTR
jgi:hypothetical protein